MSQPLLCGVLTLSPTHCGTGQASGAVDLPIAREVHTHLPVLPASTIKGVVRDWFGQPGDETDAYKVVKTLFGPRPPKRQKPDREGDSDRGEDEKRKSVSLEAGNVVFLEGMLLAFPVRSLLGVYRMVTSPMLIGRLRRVMMALGRELPGSFVCPMPGEGEVLLPAEQSGPVSLEDRLFSTGKCMGNSQVGTLAGWLGRFVSHDPGDADRTALERRLVVVRDEVLQDLVRRGTAVSARIVLNHDNKTSDNLWYEEALPPDTLFAVVMADRPGAKGDPTDVLRRALRDPTAVSGASETPGDAVNINRYGQIGGNVTVGQGLVRWTIDVEVQP